MFADSLKDIEALPGLLTKDGLVALGWSVHSTFDTLSISKDSLEVVFLRLPFGPSLTATTLDLKKLIWREGENYLRFVDSESPYTQFHPCIDFWGGYKNVRYYTDALSVALHNISIEER